MKTLKFISVALLLFVAVARPTFAQTTTDNMAKYTMENGLALKWTDITIDSAGTAWSQTLDLTGYDNYAWTTDGVGYGGKATTAASNPKLLLDYWVCYSDPDVNANWILANDSLLTINATTVFSGSITARLTTKAPYIKFKLTNIATGKAVTDLDLGLYFIKKDEL